MIPKVHKAGGGARGLVRYLVDKDPARVDWCANIGMPDQADPAAAAMMMESLIADAPTLKKMAGVSNRGRPLTRAVEHLSLSWPPGSRVDPGVGLDAARSALEALGYGGCMAVAVAHSDTDHPHVHVGVCRVDPETGKARGAKQNNGRILSKWALEYEREHGGVVVPGRADPAARGDAGRSARDARGRPMKWSADDLAVWERTHRLAEPTTAADRSKIKRKLLIRRECLTLGGLPAEAPSRDDRLHAPAPDVPLRNGRCPGIAPRMKVEEVDVPDVPERDWIEVALPHEIEREGLEIADGFLGDLEDEEEEERQIGKRIIMDWAAHARSAGTDEREAIRDAKLAYRPAPDARAWRDDEPEETGTPDAPGDAAAAVPRAAGTPPPAAPPRPAEIDPRRVAAAARRRAADRRDAPAWPPPMGAPPGPPETADAAAVAAAGEPAEAGLEPPPPDAGAAAHGAQDLPWMDEPDDYDAPLPDLDDPDGTPHRSAGKAATDVGAGPGGPRAGHDDRDGQRR